MDRVLRIVSRTSGVNAALKDGSVQPAGARLAFEEVPVLVQAFRRMVRGLEWDVCELALTTYLTAKEHGVRVTALPLPVVRGFHHGAVQVLAGSGVAPKDLEGRRVGVNRGYTVTTGVWARAVLAEEHGVDLGRVTWVRSGDEHVEAYVPPPNVVDLAQGTTLEEGLRSGDLAAVVGADLDAPDVVPLLPDPRAAALTALGTRGLWPVNHLVVVRDDLLEEWPEVGAVLFDAFARAKQPYVAALGTGTATTPTDRLLAEVRDTTGGDPLPYGLEPNRRVLEELVRTAVDQRILQRPVALETVFDPATLDLVG